MWNIWLAKIIMVRGKKNTGKKQSEKDIYIYIHIHTVYIYIYCIIYVYKFGTIFGDVFFRNECLNLDPNWWQHRFCSASIEF